MRKFVALALAASILSPMAASAAVSRGELARDRADVREESRDYRQAVRRGSPAQVREERGEYRDSVRELREDRRDARNEGWHEGRRVAYDRGHGQHDRWNAPFRYTAFRPGYRADGGVYAPRYAIANPRAYGLPMAWGANRWVRHYDDAVLINLRTGMVQRVVRGVFW
jgi:Ni/Co efflux regulator RcnB